MGMTLTQKILAAHAGLPEVKAGQLINAKLDIVLGNDITTPVAINEFERAGFNSVFDKQHIAIVLDHFVPNKDIKSATQSKQCREFANKYDILNFYDVGQMGIEHALLPEKGIVTAGDCVIGADSHTCTYGALGAFSTGVGSTDMAAGMATGMAWFKVPSAIKFVLKGKFGPRVSGKDLILHIIGMIGVDGALYKSMEFTGPGVAGLTMDDRLCICNMAIEAGAKNGIFPVDDVTRSYLKGRSQREPVFYTADPDAEYEKTIEIDLDKLEPTVSYPHLPENTHPASEGKDIRVDQVVAHLVRGVGEQQHDLLAAHRHAAQQQGEAVAAEDGECHAHGLAAGPGAHVLGDLLAGGVVALAAGHHGLGHGHHVAVTGGDVVFSQCIQHGADGDVHHAVALAEDGGAHAPDHGTQSSAHSGSPPDIIKVLC